MPILRGLGWDEDDPEQVIREYRPSDKRHYRQDRVDIALFGNGVPRVFVEAKRLDREHTPEYDDQLAKYASHLDDGIAVLTNGRYWQVFEVANGNHVFQRTIDIAGGDAESVARELDKVVGRVSLTGPAQRLIPPENSVRTPSREILSESLKQYRGREARRRGQPFYTIFSNETIELIVAQRPTDLPQLGNIKGIGPSTLQRHGEEIIKIVRGEA